VVEGMYEKIFNDPELIEFYRKTDKEHLKEMQRQYLTCATGGSKEYAGKSMEEAHKGRGIEMKEFIKVNDHIISTLKELNVAEELINEVNEFL
jgi:hemoglobin